MSWKTASILVVAATFCRPVTTLDRSDTDPVAIRVARIVQSGNQEAVLDDFYYPEPTATDRASDRAGVRKTLAILYSDFGLVRTLSQRGSVPSAIDLLVAPGTVEQLNRSATFKRYLYDATFERYGEGFVYIDVCRRADGSIGLRSLSFALPASHPESVARIRFTGQRMIATLN
jgi:hypothetical protein